MRISIFLVAWTVALLAMVSCGSSDAEDGTSEPVTQNASPDTPLITQTRAFQVDLEKMSESVTYHEDGTVSSAVLKEPLVLSRGVAPAGSEVHFTPEGDIHMGMPEKAMEARSGALPQLFRDLIHGRTDAVAALLENGADIRYRTPGGFTAFHAALAGLQVDYAKQFYEELDVDIHEQVSFPALGDEPTGYEVSGMAINHLAFYGSQEDDIGDLLKWWNQDAADEVGAELITWLIALGADPDVADDDGYAPIHHAAVNGRSLMVNALLEGGANPNLRCRAEYRQDQTPLDMACSGFCMGSRDDRGDLVDSLLAYGADPRAVRNGSLDMGGRNWEDCTKTVLDSTSYVLPSQYRRMIDMGVRVGCVHDFSTARDMGAWEQGPKTFNLDELEMARLTLAAEPGHRIELNKGENVWMTVYILEDGEPVMKHNLWNPEEDEYYIHHIVGDTVEEVSVVVRNAEETDFSRYLLDEDGVDLVRSSFTIEYKDLGLEDPVDGPVGPTTTPTTSEPSGPTPLATDGGTVNSFISAIQPQAVFTIKVEEGRSYGVRITGGIDTTLTIRTQAGEQIAFNDDSDGILQSYAEFRAATSETVEAVVAGYSSNEVGDFGISAIVLPTEPVSRNRLVANAEPVIGTIDSSDRREMSYTFEVEANTSYILETGMALDTILTLYNASGESIAYNDDFGGSYSSQISFTPLTSGTYSCLVQGYCPKVTGQYSISLTQEEAAPELIEATGEFEGMIASAGDEARYEVMLNAGDRVLLETAGDLDTILEVHSLTFGDIMARNDDWNGTLLSRINYEATSADRLIVVVQGFGQSTGAFNLAATVSRVNPLPPGGVMSEFSTQSFSQPKR